MILAHRRDGSGWQHLDAESATDIDPLGAWDTVLEVNPNPLEVNSPFPRMEVTEYKVTRPKWEATT